MYIPAAHVVPLVAVGTRSRRQRSRRRWIRGAGRGPHPRVTGLHPGRGRTPGPGFCIARSLHGGRRGWEWERLGLGLPGKVLPISRAPWWPGGRGPCPGSPAWGQGHCHPRCGARGEALLSPVRALGLRLGRSLLRACKQQHPDSHSAAPSCPQRPSSKRALKTLNLSREAVLETAWRDVRKASATPRPSPVSLPTPSPWPGPSLPRLPPGYPRPSARGRSGRAWVRLSPQGCCASMCREGSCPRSSWLKSRPGGRTAALAFVGETEIVGNNKLFLRKTQRMWVCVLFCHTTARLPGPSPASLGCGEGQHPAPCLGAQQPPLPAAPSRKGASPTPAEKLPCRQSHRLNAANLAEQQTLAVSGYRANCDSLKTCALRQSPFGKPGSAATACSPGKVGSVPTAERPRSITRAEP